MSFNSSLDSHWGFFLLVLTSLGEMIKWWWRPLVKSLNSRPWAVALWDSTSRSVALNKNMSPLHEQVKRERKFVASIASCAKLNLRLSKWMMVRSNFFTCHFTHPKGTSYRVKRKKKKYLLVSLSYWWRFSLSLQVEVEGHAEKKPMQLVPN